MKKRFLAAILAACMVISTGAADGSIAYAGESDTVETAASTAEQDAEAQETETETAESEEQEAESETEESEEQEVESETEESEEQETESKEADAEAQEAESKETDTETQEAESKETDTETQEEIELPTGLMEPVVYEVTEINEDDIFYDSSDADGVGYTFYGSAAYDSSVWDKYSTNYYYNQLNETEKEFWDDLDEMCLYYLTGTADAKVDSSGNYWTGYAGGEIISPSKAVEIAQIFRYSNPQYYFLENGYYYYSIYGVLYIGFPIYPAFGKGAQRKTATAQVKKQAESWLTEASAYSTVQEQIKAVHDLIINKVDYNYDILDSSGQMISGAEDTAYSQSAYSVFCTDLTVCAGYAQAFEMICNGLGIDCIAVTSSNHEWNKIRVNDSWYNMDLTWADQSSWTNYVYFERNDTYYHALGDHDEKSMWSDYLPLCTLDSGATSSSIGSLPEITEVTAAPTIRISESDGEYLVTLSSDTQGAIMYYNMDNTKASVAETKSYRYTEPFAVEAEDAKNIRAIAVCDAHLDSTETTGKSSINVTYKVQYDGNGSTSGSMKTQSIKYASGTKLTANAFVRTGYTFNGWNTQKDGSGDSYKDKANGSLLTLTKGKTVKLYAQWKKNTYTIKFNGNGNTSGSMSSLTKRKYGTEYKLTANAFKRTGYTFTGWNTKKDGSGKSYSDQAKVKNLTSKADGTVTLYAQWKKTKYTITYKLDGGTNNKKNPTSYTVTTDTVTLKAPTRKGYTFVGWYKDSKYKNKVTKITKGSTGKLTLYAKWKKK